MRRIRFGDAVRLAAPVAVYGGLAAFTMSQDWRWLGAGMTVGVVTTLIEANRLCDRLLARPDETTAVADAAGVLAPSPMGPCTIWPPSASMDPRAHWDVSTEPPPELPIGGDFDLAAAFAELGPAFAELDRRVGPPRVPAIERRALTCRCDTVAAPRRECPVHGIER